MATTATRAEALTLGAAMLMGFAGGRAAMAQETQKSDSAAGSDQLPEPLPAVVVADHVLDAGTYTAFDYEYLPEIANLIPGQSAGCTAAAAITNDGRTIVGRNMDLAICHKPAFVVRTDVPGDYKTLGLAFITTDLVPDYQEVLDQGISSSLARAIPFLMTDVMNSEGLYIATNMRNGEVWPDGSSKYGCRGTNLSSDQTVPMFALIRVLAQRCASVREAVELARALNIVSGDNPAAWNFAFMLADSSGAYGVLEVAQDRVSFLDGCAFHTNFYLDPEFFQVEAYTCGMGRYDLVKAGIADVRDDESMRALIQTTTAFQMYTDHCAYDTRTEYVGYSPWWTGEYVLSEDHRAELEDYALQERAVVTAMTRDELRDACCYWESTFSVLADCNKKSLYVTFYEGQDSGYLSF